MGTRRLRALLLLLVVPSVFPCVYFVADDFSDQVVGIEREREPYCTISETTPDGEPVTCAGDVTATRINRTHVLLNTEEGPKVTFMLNHGRKNQPGKFADSYHADCPASSPVQENLTEPAKLPRKHYGLYAAPILVFFIIIAVIAAILFIYMNCKEGQPSRNCNGVSSVSVPTSAGAQEM